MAHEYEGNMVNEFLVSEFEDELSALRARVVRLEEALMTIADDETDYPREIARRALEEK